MKHILLILLTFVLTASAAEQCKDGEHQFAPWYLQTAMFILPEQPAHRCKLCGYWQNVSGYWSQTEKQRKTDPLFWSTVEEQIKADIGTSKAWDGFRFATSADEEAAKVAAEQAAKQARKWIDGYSQSERAQITSRLHEAYLSAAKSDELFEALLSTTDPDKLRETLAIIRSLRESAETQRDVALILAEQLFEKEKPECSPNN
jgi:hypothetical protein